MVRLAPTAALLLLGATAAVDAQRFADFRQFGQPCAPFTCASSRLAPVPKRDFVFTANGCGTAMLPISADVDFSECCNWHDACYSTCGMKKATCEKRLDKCMKAKCAQLTDASEKDKCSSTAQLFSIGAQMIACPAFQDAQRDACTCVTKSRVGAATRERLKHFLEASGASAADRSAEAVDALLRKYAGQEPKMFLRLLRKYPHALETDATKRNFMDEIFRGGAAGGEDAGVPLTSGDASRVESDDEQQASDEHVDEHIEL